jgi:hypothetical protein
MDGSGGSEFELTASKLKSEICRCGADKNVRVTRDGAKNGEGEIRKN